MNYFDSDKWLILKRDELIDLIFKNEFGIDNFRNTSYVFDYTTLMTQELINRLNAYRPALRKFFNANELRSAQDCNYLLSDTKPALNLIKQILRIYNYKLEAKSEYAYTCGDKKICKVSYTIKYNSS